jgi:hypothetical protein
MVVAYDRTSSSVIMVVAYDRISSSVIKREMKFRNIKLGKIEDHISTNRIIKPGTWVLPYNKKNPQFLLFLDRECCT